MNSDNFQEYVQLLLSYYSQGRGSLATQELIRGVTEVVPINMINVFKSEELETMLFGAKEIDVTDWKKNTFYKGAYSDEGEKHKIVKWWWAEIESLNQ